VAAPLQRALADPRVRHINIHTSRPGCLLTAVEKVQDKGGSQPGANA
jgi:hypothetical protein